MNGGTLADIKIQVETPEYETGNLQSILSEIQYALQELLEQKKIHCIDLRAMPWSPGEEQKLENYLGRGEVAIELNTLGKSTFYETQFSGVWLVSHYNQEEELIARQIEITYLPEMLFSQNEDIKNSLERLKTVLNVQKRILNT